MSYSLWLMRFVDGRAVPLDAERLQQVIAPYTAAGLTDGFALLTAEDGGEADVYADASGPDGLTGVMVTHFAKGAVLDVLARLAGELGAFVLPQDGRVLLAHEDERQHLPPEVRQDATVAPLTGEAIQAEIDRI
ncbi:hypothetical protein ACFYPA_04085 [Streptomyces sp. NPDC005775]|uniref:hypothetical protein n=1 Tax=unclassified Streptomyces TaxID=2593676 RepID=UPI003410B415